MKLEEADVTRGMKDGVARCHKMMFEFTDRPETVWIKPLGSTLTLAKRALEKEHSDWHPRAVMFFSEILTVAALSRAYYSESELKMSEVDSFLPFLRNILNSFTHK